MTPREEELFHLIAKFEKEGRRPSYEELAAEMGSRSKGFICRLIDGLCEAGYLLREPHRSRTVRIAKQKCPTCGGLMK